MVRWKGRQGCVSGQDLQGDDAEKGCTGQQKSINRPQHEGKQREIPVYRSEQYIMSDDQHYHRERHDEIAENTDAEQSCMCLDVASRSHDVSGNKQFGVHQRRAQRIADDYE